MAGRRVDRARAGLERHVLAEHPERLPRVQRMLEADSFELLALHLRDGRAERPSDRFRYALGERLGDDHRGAGFSAGSVDHVRAVIELRMKRDREIRRNRPRRRRPDQDRHIASIELRDACREIRRARRRQRKLDVNRWRRVVLVLDFCFGKRRAAVNAPVNRLLSLVDESLLDEAAERADDVRLVARLHRDVRMFPFAEDDETLEFFGHQRHEALRVGGARAAEIGARHLALLRTELAVDLQLDRQPVTVVTRHVGRIEPRHRLRLHDDVFQDLIERVTEMDVSVCVRRAVMQHELRRAAPLLADLPVQVHRIPARDRLGLGRLQVCFHRKTCARQVHRVLPLGH